MLKFAAILGKMENGCDLAAKYLQFYSFQKGKTVNLSYGKKKVIEEILSISYNQFKEVFDWVRKKKHIIRGKTKSHNGDSLELYVI